MEDPTALKPVAARQNAQFINTNADWCSSYADLFPRKALRTPYHVVGGLIKFYGLGIESEGLRI